MRKFSYAFALLAALLFGAQPTMADAVSPYTVDFNTNISTSGHDFQVAKGWGHVVDSYYDEDEWEAVYPSYSWSASYGRESSGGLRVGTQTELTASYWGTGSGKTTDLLVTPAVTGKSSIYVKLYKNSGSIKFYSMTKSGSTYTQGEEITGVDISALSTSDWTQVSIPSQDGGYIGIWASNAYLDDFEAESAEIAKEKKLKITSAKNLSGDKVYCDENGLFTITMSVTMENTGDLDIAVGDEGYSLSVINNSNNNAVVGTQALKKPLAVGETVTDTISVQVSYADYPKRNRYDVQENLMGTTYNVYAWIEPVAYVPIMELRNSNGSISSGSSFDWGKINTATSKDFTIRNKGGKALTVTSIELPEGFTASIETPFTVAPAATDTTFSVTLLTDKTGTFKGAMTINGDEVDPFSVNLNGVVLDPSKWYVTFEDQKIPAGAMAENNWSIQQIDYASASNAYALGHGSADAESKFITPLLEVAEGETMTFEVGRMSRYSSNGSLNVYYSPDRKNWTIVKAITGSELPSAQRYSSYGTATEFALEGIPAGQYYIAFGAKYVYIDNLYGFTPVDVAHDWIASTNLSKAGMVNNVYAGSATLKNNNVKDEEATYTVSLYFDDEKVATADAVTIAAGESASFDFAYTPHAAGTYNVYAVFENAADGYKMVSDSTTIIIAEESAVTDIQALAATGTGNTPLATNWKNSASESIYDADMLAAAGLKAGDKITKIYYKGYNSSDKGNLEINTQFYMANTNATEFQGTYTKCNPDTMTTVYDGTYTIVKQGSSKSLEVMIELPLAEPFIYTGQGIRIFAKHSASTYLQSYYEYGNASGHCYFGKSDSSTDFSMSSTNLPVVYFTVQGESPVLSGTVTDGTDPIAGATVTLTNGDVYYTTTTDETGAYSMAVIQNDKSYALTVEADDYEPYTEADSITVAESTTKDIVLTLKPATVTLEEGVWAAYSSKQSIDFTQTDINAYIVTAVSGENATLQRVERIPANTGVLLYGNGTYTLPKADDAEAPAKNLLIPTAKSAYTITADDVDKAYTFANNYFTKAAEGNVVAKQSAFLYVKRADAASAVYLVLPKVTFSGTVTDGVKAIAGATITITDKTDEALTVTTDAEGKFSQTVDQTNLKYLVAASAMGYNDYVATDSITALADTVLTIVLQRQPVTISIGSVGWTSFSSIFPIDFTKNEDLEVFKVTSYADGQAIVERIESPIIPAYTGVLLHNTGAPFTDCELTVVDEGTAVEGNILANTAAAALDITSENYGTVYGFAEVDNAPGFFKNEVGYTIPQGQAYLTTVTGDATEFYALYDPTTGITFTIAGDSLDESLPMYNLAGQCVAKSYHGVVIQNGKKFIKK